MTLSAAANGHRPTLRSESRVSDFVMELNASDDRGIDTVREKIKGFARVAMPKCAGQGEGGGRLPSFKLIILDEADSMTPDAQSALRRIMEIYSKVTRFCLICNYVTRIIEPLVSRTARFRFKPLCQRAVETRLKNIAAQEGFDFEEQMVQKIAAISQGDMRKAITFMQSAKIMGIHKRSGDAHEAPSIDSTPLNSTDRFLSDLAGMIQPSVLDDFIRTCKTPPNMSQLQKYTHQLVIQGYSVSQLVSQLVERLISDSSLKDSSKAHIFKELGKIDMARVEGADDELQCQHLAFTLKKHL